MSDIRKNSLGTTQVIMATERKLRPDDFIKKIGEPKDCPFCPGNEHKTPKPELLRFNDNNGGWNLRAVPNLFPAFRIESHSNFLEHDSDSNSIADAHGAHEIIIETPNHEEDFDKIPVWRIRDLLHAITLRTDDLYKDPDIPYIAVFKNSGMGAGASLRHPHTQLIALPRVPEKVQTDLYLMELYETRHGHCMFQGDIGSAEKDGRIVQTTKNFACYVPYAPKAPFEMVIVPLQKQSRLVDSRPQFEELAELIKIAFTKLTLALGFLPEFNFLLNEVPPKRYYGCERFVRWHWQIFPRLTRIAGFELITGYYINPTLPEEAASCMREVEV